MKKRPTIEPPEETDTKYYLMRTTAGLEAWRIEIDVTEPPYGHLAGIKTHFCRYRSTLDHIYVSVPGIKNEPGFEEPPPRKLRAWAAQLRDAWTKK